MNLQPILQFNLRAKRLAESRFLTWLNSRPKNFDPKNFATMDWLEAAGVEREDLDAFCLNLRLLIQDRDGFSLRCIHRIHENLPGDYADYSELAAYERKRLKEYLDSSSLVRIDEKICTNKELFDVLFYGGLAHENPDLVRDYVRLTNWGVFTIFTMISFWNVVLRLCGAISRIALINEGLLQALEKTNEQFVVNRELK